MAVPAGYDIGLDSTDPADANAVRGFMLVDHRQQDITPSSARRSDGDTRFQLIPSESFWSQSDFSGGFGRWFPSDPTMYLHGGADTTRGTEVRSPWRWTGAFTTPTASAQVLAICAGAAGQVYLAVNDGGTGKLYYQTAPSASWTFVTNLGSASVTAMVFFRGTIWIGYGAAANVQQWDGAALNTPAPNFKAQQLSAYSSMLFYAYYASATKTWRLNRYDPENTTAVADLAVLAKGTTTSDYVRSLVSLGPDLFVVCRDALYKFTSQNGNSGVLAGPVDTWVPSGGTGGDLASGYGAAGFQGALVYSCGIGLRRHQPGGGSKQIWPVPPNAPNYDASVDQAEIGIGLAPTQLLSFDDRLYVIAASSLDLHSSGASSGIYLLAWTGAGMHQIGSETLTFAASVAPGRNVGAVSDSGFIFAGSTRGSTTMSANTKVGYWVGRPTDITPRQYYRDLTLSTSWLDFGLVDLDKVLSDVGVLCQLPNDYAWSVALTADVLDESASPQAYTTTTLTVVAGGEPTTLPGILYFAPTGYLVGKLFRFNLTVTGPATPTEFARVFALTATPNPVYPLRYGFRVTIPVGTHVRLHNGAPAYASQGEVDTALAYLRTLRASSYPFTLDWIDGSSYTVRCNTISIVRDVLRGTAESAWLVTLDLQQLSNYTRE